MPELPEVELSREKLAAWCVGRRIASITAIDGPPLVGTTARELSALEGARIESIDRVGKQMVMRTDGPSLLLHLGMTGHFERSEEAKSRVSMRLDDGSRIALVDPRRLGRVRLLAADADPFAGLGPDALKVAGRRGGLARCVGEARGPIKVVLMDQARIAGVGNIYASEACFEAGVHPALPARSLSEETLDRVGKALVASMRRTLRAGRRDPSFRYRDDEGNDGFRVYGRAGEPCPRCHTDIERVVQAGRSTYLCRRCQPRRTPARSRRGR